ncbi:hypothetical protein CHT23_002672 [Salmonella enterica subsp. houtenae serovar 48:z4,z32:-]|uniref:Phage protein n=1 Tax=Salmonella enterica subsp. houtenae serovar 48:z4,z32:- TaxID=2577535 RepID=A0A729FVJ8_SALHO|nr:hypothetical protein [Salmonella enterica subsp. houtenae]EAN3147888.1 hypothetical protein [Salmonella enterica]EDU9324702.1 hypothetical protein [Salmonella enterica subsp. enterica]EDW4110738.1 hypothetical protein [Salmonella enterica subsp. arizonae]EDW5430768.1 hypothetical protein [Salmonella enterica subsp. enterica serovar Djakarta]EEE1664948.1 hypothetical protein [Salmonella enterica subsp. houtenae serovar 48:z4,z32:-]
MCSPAIAMVAVTVASTAASMYSQNQQAKYTSAVAEKNADVAEAQAQAQDSINRGNAEADQRRREMRQRQGTQAATMAATGAELGSGSSLDIFGDTAQFGALDALTTVNNAQREAYGFRVQGANYQSQADSARSTGSAGLTQTLLTAPLKAYGAYQMGGGTWNPFTQSKAAPISAAIGTPTGR